MGPLSTDGAGVNCTATPIEADHFNVFLHSVAIVSRLPRWLGFLWTVVWTENVVGQRITRGRGLLPLVWSNACGRCLLIKVVVVVRVTIVRVEDALLSFASGGSHRKGRTASSSAAQSVLYTWGKTMAIIFIVAAPDLVGKVAEWVHCSARVADHLTPRRR